MYIYNETNKPYSYKEGKEVGIIFRKAVKGRTKEAKFPKVKKVHLLAHNSVVDKDFVNKINNAVETTNPVKITTKQNVLYFSKKDLSPFVTNLGEGCSTVLMATIKLRENNITRRIIDIEHPYIFLLKGYIFGGELTIAASFVEQSKDLVIRFLEGDNIVKYIFKNKNGRIELVKETTPNDKNITATKRFEVKTYVPTRLTHGVLCYGKDKKSLSKVIGKDKLEQHKIIEINNKTLEAQLLELKQDNYGAVTIFIDQSELNDAAQKIYRKVMKLTQTHLRIVMLAFNNGDVKKIKQ